MKITKLFKILKYFNAYIKHIISTYEMIQEGSKCIYSKPGALEKRRIGPYMLALARFEC